jgi:hypothetical protein
MARNTPAKPSVQPGRGEPTPVTVEAIYAAYNTLSGDADAPDALNLLLDSVKSTNHQVRTLTAQFLPQFIHKFPDDAQKETVLDAQIDLCEDPEVSVRFNAIKGLAGICKSSPQHVARIADILGQLLTSGDAKELAAVKAGYAQIISIDKKAALQPLFVQIASDPEIREPGLAFIVENIALLFQPSDDVLFAFFVENLITLGQTDGFPLQLLINLLTPLSKLQSARAPHHGLSEVLERWALLHSDFQLDDLDNILDLMQFEEVLFVKENVTLLFLKFLLKKVASKFGKLHPTKTMDVLKAAFTVMK